VVDTSDTSLHSFLNNYANLSAQISTHLVNLCANNVFSFEAIVYTKHDIS
jgi:hypothetical protein